MNGTVKEWIQEAEGDYTTAAREVHARESPNYDAACFHAEQCVEKLMKALPIHRGVTPPRPHDLAVLDRLLAPACLEWLWPVEELRLLTRAAVEFRYPGESADAEQAAKAFETATRMRSKLRELLDYS